jgi:hypothetical protein
MARERHIQEKEEELRKIAIAIEKLRTAIELRRRSGKNLKKRFVHQERVIKLIGKAKKLSAEIANG